LYQNLDLLAIRKRKSCALIRRQRVDGGFWLKNAGQIDRPKENETSCGMATMLVLGASTQNPKLRTVKSLRQALIFFLGIGKTGKR
jgi:hypothetical protein